MKWIHVEDGLPKEARLEVLVSNGHSVAPAWWVGGRFEAFCTGGMALKWVTHWSRFPTPPEKQGSLREPGIPLEGPRLRE